MDKILLIEDDPILNRTISKIFADRLYQIKSTTDGEIGLKSAKSESYDLIILDLMLPKMSGFLVIKSLRSIGIETPILVVSSKNQLSDLMTALSYGADAYVYKPFNMSELLCRSEALLKRPSHSKKRQVIFGDLTYDSELCQIRKAKRELRIQKRQQEILKYLMENNSRIVSKQELIDYVWNSEDYVNPATIDVHISKLRDALDEAGSKTELATFHGFGFRLAKLS